MVGFSRMGLVAFHWRLHLGFRWRIITLFVMLTLCEVSKGYGGRMLFVGATLQINRGDRIGLVGPNGAGKSTLFSLILEEETPDEGKILMERRASVGHLPQESAPAGRETVLELATAINPEVADIQRRLKEMEHEHYQHDESSDHLHARYEELGGYTLEPRAKSILSGLGFREKDFNRLAMEMSGGWVMRAHLAKLLVQSPDILLLDEPTNHLDLDALIWFQNYLKNYEGAILLISHDREFLNQLVGSIVEIRQSRLFQFHGNYESYLEQREAQREALEAAYNNQQKEIAHLMDFVNRFRAKNTKAAQAQSKLKQIARMDKVEAPENDERKTGFYFPQPMRSGLKTITLEKVAHAYGAMQVYENLNIQVQRGQRVVLVGPNGAGKSTLMKLLAGVLPVQSGTRELGLNVRLGYYSQYRIAMLHEDRTVLEEALDTPQRITETFVRTILGSFGFSGDDVFKAIPVLSGGEKSRLALVKLLLDPPNLLLMDEPTTHLDMDGVNALVGALEQFEGTLVFISHDVFFIRSLANHVVRVCNGQVTHYAGDYQYYLDREAADAARLAAIAAKAPAQERPVGNVKEQRRLKVAEQNARAKLRRDQQHKVHKLETEIAELERLHAALTAELQLTATYEKQGRILEINMELARIHDDLPRLNAQWEAAASRLAEIEAIKVQGE
jgi:ATP-binding cassette subfamily F protein 3